MAQHVIEHHSDLMKRVLVMGSLTAHERVRVIAFFPGDGTKKAKALHIPVGLALAHGIREQVQLCSDTCKELLLDRAELFFALAGAGVKPGQNADMAGSSSGSSTRPCKPLYH